MRTQVSCPPGNGMSLMQDLIVQPASCRAQPQASVKRLNCRLGARGMGKTGGRVRPRHFVHLEAITGGLAIFCHPSPGWVT